MITPAAVPLGKSSLWWALLPPLILASVLLATFALKLRNLGHSGLTRWDEVYHAVVARNVMKHPLTPTLVDEPYLPYDFRKWGENHVWLHKPILPFWQVALCFVSLGVNTFALRVPAALLSTGAAWCTYLIGKELFDRRTALAAASLQAVSPFLMKLIHGYQFADTVDIALLFWVEVGMLFLVRGLRTGSWRDVLLAGAAQGLAYLCKSYLAAIILGVALTAWLLPMCGLVKRDACRIRFAHLLGLVAATLGVVGPWTVHCLIHFPDEFWHEHGEVWRHLYDSVEIWAAPWDRLIFDYLIAIYGVFYTPVLMACVVLVAPAISQRHAGLWLTYAWGFGVILPHVLAVTKTPSATVIAVPAFLLLLGNLIARASRGQCGPLAGLTGILAMSLLVPAVVREPGFGYPGVMRQALWVVGHVACTLGMVIVAALVRPFISAGSRARVVVPIATFILCLCPGAWLVFQTVRAAWRVTDVNLTDRSSVEVGRFARQHLPENAVLFCEEPQGYEHLTLMFHADRTCYLLGPGLVDERARQVEGAGGIAYVVTRRKLPLEAVHVRSAPGPTVYRWKAP